jgi:hypothetical protein
VYISRSLRRVNIVLIKFSYSLSLLRVYYSVEIFLSKVLKIPSKISPSLRTSVIYLVLVSSSLRCYFISLSCPIILRCSFFYSWSIFLSRNLELIKTCSIILSNALCFIVKLF